MKIGTRWVMIGGLLLCSAKAAWAEPPGASTSTVATNASPTTHDPNGDRNWFSSTAFVQPQGAVMVSNHMGLLGGVTLGVTDRFALDGHVGFNPFVEAGEYLGGVGAKFVIGSIGRFHFAANANFVRVRDDYNFVDAAHAGVVVSTCLTKDCGAVASASVAMGRAQEVVPNYKQTGSFAPMVNVGIFVPIAKWFKLAAEINTIPFAEDDAFLAAPAAGVRFHSDRWVVEAVAVARVESSSRDRFQADVLPFPWLSAAYRFQL